MEQSKGGKEEILKRHLLPLWHGNEEEMDNSICNLYEEIGNAMDEYKSIKPVNSQEYWIKEKPNKECVFIAATKINDIWEYTVYMIKTVCEEEGSYLGWLTGDGDEYGDLNDMKADLYFIIPPPKKLP